MVGRGCKTCGEASRGLGEGGNGWGEGWEMVVEGWESGEGVGRGWGKGDQGLQEGGHMMGGRQKIAGGHWERVETGGIRLEHGCRSVGDKEEGVRAG